MHKNSRLLLTFVLLFTLLGSYPVSAHNGQPVGQDPKPWNPERPEQNVQIFLPVIVGAKPASPYKVSGQVTDAEGKPLQGVTIEGSNGDQVTTDASGSYSVGATSGEYGVTASKDGYAFDPSVIDLNISTNVTGQDFTAVTACSETVSNGSFETSGWWNLMEGLNLFPSSWSTAVAHSGARSVRMGINNLADRPTNPEGLHSRVRSPLINIPASTSSATLRLWLYPVSSETVSRPAEPTPQSANSDLPTTAFGDMTLATDAQYVNILNSSDVLIGTMVYMRSNNQFWSFHQFDLSAYAGQSIKIEIGVYNDNANGVTSLYADDVSLTMCGGTPPPPPPPPATCNNQVSNSDFEYNANWNIPYTAYPAAYSYNYAYSGARSMRTGIPLSSYGNTYSYSDAWQNVFIPSGISSAVLKVRLFPLSEEPGAMSAPQNTPQSELGAELPNIDPNAQLPEEGTVWDEKSLAPDASDAQYILVLNPYTGLIRETLLWWTPRDAAGWQYREFDLSKYAGQTIRIQVGTFNNGYGGRSVMYVDNLVVDTCGGGITPPPPPPTCTERIGNGSFENNASWYIPYTSYSAGYSTWLHHTGLRSMRTGIVYSYHNRYSYSDVRQTVTIPSGASTATLRFYAYSMSTEPPAYRMEQPADSASPELAAASAMSGDVQYLLVLDQWGNWINTLVWRRSNEQYWRNFSFNLNQYIGRTIILQWGTYNDGWNGVSSMYVDDISLQACP